MNRMFKRIFNVLQCNKKNNSVVADDNVTGNTPTYNAQNITSEWNYMSEYNDNKVSARFSWKSCEIIDTFVFLLGKDNKIVKDSDLIFYNSEIRRNSEGLKTYNKEQFRNEVNWLEQTFPCSENGAIWIEPDCYNEDIEEYECCDIVHIDLRKVENCIKSILFAHVVYSSPCHPNAFFGKNTDFHIYIREEDASGELVSAHCENLEDKNILLSCALKREQNGWKFELMNECVNGPVQNLIDMYVE